MSSKTRANAAALRIKYAKVWQIAIDDVIIEEFRDDNDQDDARIYAPAYDSPIWTVGQPLEK